jgi:RNA polymerase sigma-70 factor (ECF subfamily)
VWLRRVDELPQKQVAQILGTTPKMVEKYLRKGVLRLTAALFGSQTPQAVAEGGKEDVNEEGTRHG